MLSEAKFLCKPVRYEEKKVGSNIFASTEEERDTPVFKEKDRLPHIHHFVGPAPLRKQLLSKEMQSSKKSLDQFKQLEEMRNLNQSPQDMVSTLRRSTLLTKRSQSEMRQITRDHRNMQFYKDYEQQWKQQSKLTRKRTDNIMNPTLLDRSKKSLQVFPNPEKEDVVQNHINSYWEMSLRNNHFILKRHLKGQNTFKESEMEAMILSQEGLKQVEEAVPKLPLGQLSKMSGRELVMTGKNKLASESASCDPSIVTSLASRRSKAATELPPLKQEVWKSNYDSSHRYLME